MKNILFIMISVLLGCEKEPIRGSSDTTKIIWRKQLGPELYDIITQDPEIHRDKLIFGYQTNTSEGYYIFNKNNGQLLKDIEKEKSFEPFSKINGSIYYSNFGFNDYRTINLENYEIKYHKLIQGEYKFAGVFPNGEYLYTASHAIHNGLNKNKILWKRAKTISPTVWEDIYTCTFKDDEDLFGSSSGSINFSKNSNNDEILYFASVNSYNNAGKKANYKITAFNLTKKFLVWETDAFGLDVSHNIVSIGTNSIITGNQIIFSLGSEQIKAYDLQTGKELWSSNFSNMTFTDYYEKNGKISFLSDIGDLHMVDSSNGKLLSKKVGFLGNTKGWAFHKGIMYFTTASGKLYGVDAETHETKLEYQSPNKDKCSYCDFFLQNPIVDPETDRLYITDGKEVICYQLPK